MGEAKMYFSHSHKAAAKWKHIKKKRTYEKHLPASIMNVFLHCFIEGKTYVLALFLMQDTLTE